ncbi:hypothetical protein L843_2739 [Mycobacterium intracellulare MIN_061107_1834]|nr:hypothetical protein L843_2739 [Mycobacterium intracellulare MIN_061107_1834]
MHRSRSSLGLGAFAGRRSILAAASHDTIIKQINSKTHFC